MYSRLSAPSLCDDQNHLIDKSYNFAMAFIYESVLASSLQVKVSLFF